MCSNLLEKISKEERESESGGMVDWWQNREGEVYKITGMGMVVSRVVKLGHKSELL